MQKTALIYHEDYLKHDAGFGHPERKERLIATMDYFKEKRILGKVSLLRPTPATEEDLLRVHTRQHVDFIRDLSKKGGGIIDPDTIASENTYDIARLAAGGVILAGEVVMQEKAGNSFALVRPPGHHATSSRAMGFCYFNNVAISIRYLQEKFSLKRIFLLDWDAHAFNGTMEILYSDPGVLKVSLHQDPRFFYPHEGFIDQVGDNEGRGYTVNIPLKVGSSDADYLHIMENFLVPLIDSYKPELFIISAGQDSHYLDPISGLNLTEEGYGRMTEILVQKANEFSRGKIFVELEGGYNPEALARSNYEIIKALMYEQTEDFVFDRKIQDSTEGLVHSLRKLFKEYHGI